MRPTEWALGIQEDIARLSPEPDPDPRAARLAAGDKVAYDADEAFLAGHDDRLARGEGSGADGASAEETVIRYRVGES